MMTPPERSPVVLVYSPRAREGSPLVRRIERFPPAGARKIQHQRGARLAPAQGERQMTDKATDVVRAREMLEFVGWEKGELRDLLRRCIAGLSPEAADAAIVDLFHEIDILDEMMMEESRPCPF
jgi:hypothetical protein